MPAPASTQEFIGYLRKSGLTTEEKLHRSLRKLDQQTDPSMDRLVQTLIHDGLLTRFQAQQLTQGRYKRFILGDKYRILELLGVGGMGAVYLCQHILMQRLVAVKILPIDKLASDKTALQRFHREAQAVAALDHPNIVRAYDIDRAEQLNFLVMEYVDGRSLQDIVATIRAKGQWFSPLRAAHYIAQAASGLAHAGALGLIHRDIKPGNLLLDRTGIVKILDMGLARFFDHRHDGLTARIDDSCVLGTADYLAPEQATNDPIDTRADLYCLGGTLYFLLTGSSPFPDGTIAAKLLAHQTKKPRPISEFRADVPKELLAVVEKLMARKPEDRFQSPAEVLTALEPWTSQTIESPDPDEMPELCPAVAEMVGVTAQGQRSSNYRYSLSGGNLSGSFPRADSSSDSLSPLTMERVDTTRPSVTATFSPIRPPSQQTPLPTILPALPVGYSLQQVILIGLLTFVLGLCCGILFFVLM